MTAPRHLLVVEDDGGVRDMLRETLQYEGYRVTAADGGASMRELLRTDASVDLVVLDAAMPGENSPSLAIYLKGLRMPLVMISGSPQMMEFAQGNKLQLLRKPFKAADLVTAIDRAFDSCEFGQRDDA